MKFLNCSPPHWRVDDFSSCVREDLFQVLLPLIAVGASFLYFLLWTAVRIGRRRRRHRYQQLPVHVATPRAEGESTSSDASSDTDEDDDEFAEHLSLRHTISRSTAVHELKVDKPRGEKIAVAIEVLAVVGILGIFISTIASGEHHREGWPLGLISWAYILFLVTLRMVYSTKDVDDFPPLWDHTALLYMFNFVLSAVAFRSALIHPLSKLSLALTSTEFALVAILCILTITVRRGNKAITQDITEGLEPSREPLASLFSLATFSWCDPLMWKGYKKPLNIEDVWNLREDDLAAQVLLAFRQTKKTSSLAWTLAKHFKRDVFIQAIWAAFSALFTFAPTLLLRVILEYVAAPKDTPKNVAWLFVVLLFVTACFVAVGAGQALFIGRRICIRLRAVIIGEIYSKALRRKAAATADKSLGKKDDKQSKNKSKTKDNKDAKDSEEDEGQVNTGAIINLMAVDSFKVSEVCAYLHFLIASVPVQVVMAVYLLYRILGWSSIAGIGIMVLLLPINYVISSRFSAIQKRIMETTDKRIHTTNEVLQNIRIIKFFAWEGRYGDVVTGSRIAELAQLRSRYLLWAAAATSWYGSPIFITFLSFLCYTVIEKKPLEAPVAFTALSLFNVLRVPLDQLADMLTNVLQSKVSVDRVQEFLAEEETEKYHQLLHAPDVPDAPLIGFKNATITWGSKKQAASRPADAFQLQGLDITFVPGYLNVITGPTGSGKSSLLMALLGEMTHLCGSVHLPGGHSREELEPDAHTGLTQSVAYCAQQPWLVNDTIKNNILFACPYDEGRYKAVVIACSLERDFRILDAGDETEVGEKGIGLSGGQKQRISLARAMYSNSSYLLFDDCLSAVDSHTAKWIYDYCICGPLMSNRTCILVTHNVALCVPSAKHVVAMENGRVFAQGTPEEVLKTGALGDDELLKSGVRSRPMSRMPSRVPSYVGEPQMNGNGTLDRQASQQAKATLINENGNAEPAKSIKEKKSSEETKAEGGVDWKVYALYLSSMGPWWYWIFVVVIFVAQQLGSVASSVWIRNWASHYETQGHNRQLHARMASSEFSGTCHASGSCMWALPPSNDSDTVQIESSDIDVMYYLTVYAAIGVVYTFLSFLREAIVFAGSLKASRDIHQTLLTNVMRAKIRFFDSTPLGRIMNRFSKDIESVDQEVAPVALGMIHSLGAVLAIIVLISIITPGFLVGGIFITFLYGIIGMLYLRASRDLKRLESIQRSPLYQHFGETLNGVSTIRAYGDERRFVRENLVKIDTHNRPFFYLWAANRWLGLRCEVAGACVAFLAGCFVVANVDNLDAAAAGLSLTYAITFSDNILWVVRLYSMNEQNMNSVERIREFLEVDQEAPDIVEDNRPPTSWPDKGEVTFDNYSTRYRPGLDLVLRNVTFNILPGEKVGIVGRTGAGKSSLALALFRSLEAEGGKIKIDGIDISTIGLRDLRQAITMVPQDPTLFTGTIRSNLDPFGTYTDAEIFGALKRVHLIGHEPEPAAPVAGDSQTFNKNVFLDLQSPVAENGNNLSQGQKQLLCLARALLRSPKVLLMDEATASISRAEDDRIQATIRELSGQSIITIAHRLLSIIYYNKVLVLDQGEVLEYDHPYNLLKNKKGVFYDMCESSGEMDLLQEMAKKAYMNSGALIETEEDQ